MSDTYYASVRESPAGANKRHMAVFNANGSGKTMVVYRIKAVGAPTSAVTGMVIPIASIRLTGAPAGGTPLAFAKAVPGNPSVPAQVTVLQEHTSGTVEAIAFGLACVSGEETASANGDMVYEAPLDGSQMIEFPEGSGFEVRQGTLASAGNVSIVAVIGLK